MTNEKLATRAVACKRWRWMPGMLAKTVWAETRILGGQADRPVLENTAYPFLPDLTDPATVGALLSLVREAWDDPTAHAVPNGGSDGGWRICDEHAGARYVYGRGDTESEALVDALEMF